MALELEQVSHLTWTGENGYILKLQVSVQFCLRNILLLIRKR